MVVKQDTRAKKFIKNKKNFKGIKKNLKFKPENKHEVEVEEQEVDDGNSANKTKVHLVSQEIKFAKTLAGNDPVLRQKNLNKFKKWLKIRSESSYPFTDADFLRLWQGLFYCMWMSDKPLTQESLAEDIASLLHCFPQPTVAIQFYGTFLKTMCDGWFGIDQWRIDKFMMLVRRVTRQALKLLKNNEWDTDLVMAFQSKIGPTILSLENHNFAGLTMHYAEIYLEELAKISMGNVSSITVGCLIRPFAEFLESSRDKRLLQHIKASIFYHLIKQSDLGREYQERYEIWKEAGCPTESVDDCIIKEKIIQASDDEDENSDEEENDVEDDDELKEIDKEIKDIESRPLDPRAGDVSVDIPEIIFEPQQIISMFEKVLYKPTTNKRNRDVMKNIIDKMQEFMNDVYPFTERGFPVIEKIIAEQPDIDEAAQELQEFEEELYGDTRKFKKIRKHLKHFGKEKRAKAEKLLRKLGGLGVASTNSSEQEATDIVEEEVVEKHERKPYHNTWMEEDMPEEDGAEGGEDSFIKRRQKSPKMKKVKANKPKEESKDESEPQAVTTPPKSALKRRITTDMQETPKSALKKRPAFKTDDEWSQPLKDGEVEIFLPSRKTKLAEIANKESGETEILITPHKKKKLLLNPFASAGSKSATPSSKQKLRGKSAAAAASRLSLDLKATPSSSEKRVKIALDKNCHQDPREYLRQVKSSPQIPHDSAKRPIKGLLKPNLMPSPINPFYKK